ncbi:flagellar hook-basal body protein (plasmid) [Rossellomorea sp. AcN35-11]|nr:flagellar hook-basal body protein [Rossellomorea aquimaris]WJV32242.1 flagellar hook-basal body protein [Rossellomorea sp. AcN35-11]
MLRGFYTAASGMVAQQRQIDMNSNNMANANTPGFKVDQSSLRAFPEMLLTRMGASEPGSPKGMVHSGVVGPLNTGVYMQEATPLMKQGDIRETGNITDVAIWNGSMPVNPETNEEGSVLYQVQTRDGVAYTRNGTFSLDGQGYLTTGNGNMVLNEEGETIQIAGDVFEVKENGVIEGSVAPGDRIAMAYSDKPSDLVKEGNGLFISVDPLPNAREVQGVEFILKQGFVEGSNVDLQQTMTNMMNSYRMFEMNQKVLKSYDQSMEKAVTEIGRVR